MVRIYSLKFGSCIWEIILVLVPTHLDSEFYFAGAQNRPIANPAAEDVGSTEATNTDNQTEPTFIESSSDNIIYRRALLMILWPTTLRLHRQL